MAIVKMNKIFIVGPVDDQVETIQLLQTLGVVHVEPASEMAGEYEKKNNEVLSRVQRLDRIMEELARFKGKAAVTPVAVADEELTAYAEEKLQAFQDSELRVQSLQRMIADLRPWGNFDLAHIRTLEASGVHIRRYRMDAKKFEEFQPPENVMIEVADRKKEVLFYTLSFDEPQEIPNATMLSWPEKGLDEAEAELSRHQEQMKSLSAELASLAARAEIIKKQWIATLNEVAFTGTLATLHRDPYLFGLQGWIPQNQESTLHKKLEESRLPLHLVTREPFEDEEPPILIRNNWFVQRILPLQSLYGFPKYRHLDPSPFFAFFMVMFFGICMGDLGYGLLVYSIGYLMGRKWSGRSDTLDLVIKLIKAFAVSSMIIGILTGSVFGYPFENRSWVLLDLDVNAGNPMILFYISLGLGVVHLTLSYLMGIAQALYFYQKMQKLGIMFVLWGGVLLIARAIWFGAPDMVLNLPMYYGGIGFLALGILLTLLFPNDSKKWAARLGVGLWNVYGLTSLVGDLLSYARLFGLGIATGSVASVMNQLAVMTYDGLGPVIGGPFALLIIVAGHAFNLALAILGSTVHSARMHFVESFKNFFEGGGIEYKPFKIERGSL
ncbi:MAG: V-type ATPase 116kDa subunit family protein [Desulfomonilia bacterium]